MADPSIYDVPTMQDRDHAAQADWPEHVEAWARRVAMRLSAARQTNYLNTGWHDLEAEGRALFHGDKKEDRRERW